MDKEEYPSERLHPTASRQKWLIFMCFMAYTVSYLTRYSYNSNIVAIREAYEVSRAEAGLVGTFYFFAYGIGQVVNGILCKRYNKKWCIAGALATSAIVNFILFFSPTFSIYKWLWLVNGIALSFLWTSLLSILSENLDDCYLGRAVLIMSLSISTGTCLSYGSGALFNLFDIYHYEFLLVSVIAILFVFAWIFTYDGLVKTSQSKVVRQEENTVDTATSIQIKTDSYSFSNIVLVFVLPGILILIENLVKDGLNTWVPEILKTTFGYPNELSIALTIGLPLIGMLGSTLALALNKKIKDYLLLSGVLYTVATLCVGIIVGIMFGRETGVFFGILMVVVFCILSLFMYSINSVMTSIIPMFLRDRYNTGMVAGVLNGCGYVGSTLSSYGLGLLADREGWDGVFILLLALSISGMLIGLLAPLIVNVIRQERTKS